ncbi:MAG: hypothetical protein KY054_01165 [Candidatus Nealsonbacteria bacterium]|nr:hypothetical protein [Candidatus Nealsonbacteria bacterium]
MEKEILEKIEAQSKRIEEIYASIEKIKKYLLWTFIATVAMVILPIIVFILIIPRLLGVLSDINLII